MQSEKLMKDLNKNARNFSQMMQKIKAVYCNQKVEIKPVQKVQGKFMSIRGPQATFGG